MSTEQVPLQFQYQDVIAKAMEEHEAGLQKINRVIWENPELGFEEFQAHDNLVAFLRDRGFDVIPNAYGVKTSFAVEYGGGGRVVTFNAEYDALPGIGHACGHNLIATSSLAAFLGLATAVKASGVAGRVRLLGTPAEEGGGGKNLLIDAGAYKDVDACLMSHPGPNIMSQGSKLTGLAYMTSLAMSKFGASFAGKPAHAAAAPYQGVNALDAMTLAYNAVSMLRQQTKEYDRIHFVIEKGGDVPNVIPTKAICCSEVRSATMREMNELKDRVKKCFEGAAIATGCELEFEEMVDYADQRPNKPLCSIYADEMAALGTPVACDFTKPPPGGGSSDQGNVSYACPAFQSVFGIEAAPGAYNHTAGFTEAAGTEDAYKKSIETAKGMAHAGWKVLTDDALAKEIWSAYKADEEIQKGLSSE